MKWDEMKWDEMNWDEMKKDEPGKMNWEPPHFQAPPRAHTSFAVPGLPLFPLFNRNIFTSQHDG